MSTTRILVKLAGASPGARIRAVPFGATGIPVELQRLFSVPAPAGIGLAAGGQVHTWHLLNVQNGSLGATSTHPWDLAHAALQHGLGAADVVVAAEPDLEQSWHWQEQSLPGDSFAARSTADCTPEGQKGGKYDEGDGFGWHLADTASGLRAARETVGGAAGNITIVHLDTGYDPDHVALPTGVDRDRQRNFIDGEDSNDAADHTPRGGALRNRGHGTGTIGILAGGDANGLKSLPDPPQGFGAIGGAPGARVVPVRIANSVVQFRTSTVARGIDYAREIGADVVSMSMGGLPSYAWADAVNLAYDAGVVLVCAAGNSYAGLPTSLIVYPARFQRVIAACGIMAEGHPFHGLGGPMEGNVGPASKMATAMAAYAPNIPWLRLGCHDVADMDGSGTSSATPQIAAAAGLWLAKHGNDFPRGWQRVEAVRAALFASADQHGRDTQNDPDPFFGRGSLRAAEALLDKYIPAAASLRQTAPDSAAFAFLHLLSSAFGVSDGSPTEAGMLQLELTQLALNSREAREAIPDPGVPADQVTAQQRRRLFEAILDGGNTSRRLNHRLEALLGRPQVIAHSETPAATGDTTATGSGTDIVRRVMIMQPPTRRRLRVFATDPGDSSRLQTSFVNTATVEVPWENNLRPGPVGEYLEVVDVDPASGAAYDPVDLGHEYLLGQDGHAPSEGNPQFHQQMVYAVAMRTVRNFEVALGRRVLWAERRLQRQGPGAPFVPAPDGGYVQRLRIYPHAMREENAYYSPAKKSLLFGYFPTTTGNNKRRTVFTCLSHDIVAHETTHAVLDGLHPHYQENTNPDVLAFHEAFADIVAIFQHFTLPELLSFEIARLRGDLTQASMLSDLARQFGQSLHNGRALRRALDRPDPKKQPPNDPTSDEDAAPPLRQYDDAQEPHERGAILVAAVFEAFVAIYQRRTDDLMRLATGGTGVLQPGAIPTDLVARLANTAADTAQRVLTICMRALDYMAPIDPTFGDYLRAVVTSDADLAPDHGVGYRVAFAEAFNARGIYPPDIFSVGPDALCWQPPDGSVQRSGLGDFVRSLDLETYNQSNRRLAFQAAKANAAGLHNWLAANLDAATAASIGLDFTVVKDGRPLFEVHSVRPARRITAEGESRNDVVAILTQWQRPLLDPVNPSAGTFLFRGGTTLLVSREFDSDPVRYAISRPVSSKPRQERMRRYEQERGGYNSLYATVTPDNTDEPFGMLHRGL
jgi:subtilisin family serine protease